MKDLPEQSLAQLIDRRVRDALAEMGDRPPRDKEALAGTVEKLLRAKPLAADHGLDLLSVLKSMDQPGPRALDSDE